MLTDTTDALGLENTCWLSYHTWALLLWRGNGQQSVQCNKSPHADWHNRCSRTGKYLLTVLPHLVIAIVMVVNGEMANNLCSAIRVPMLTDTTDALGLENTCWLSYHTWSLLLWWLSTGKWPTNNKSPHADALGLENTCWLLTTPGHCYCARGNGQQSV